MAVHQTLLDAASRLFAERGVSRTTVDDIAEAADVARQTVFNHFPYKEAFALELGADGVGQIAEYAYVSLEAGVPALEVFNRSDAQLLDAAIAQGESMVVVARELLHPDVSGPRRAAERVPLCHLIEVILLQAREEGSTCEDLPLDIVATRMSAS